MRVLGFDVGFGHTKIFSDGIKEKFPTQIAYAPQDQSVELEKVNVAGTEYVIGRDAKYSQFRIEIPSAVELIRYAPIILRYVYVKCGEFEKVVTGLPPNCRGYVQSLIESIKSVTNADIMVLPQGVGILYDVAEKVADEAVIIDIGYNTVDCIVAEKVNDTWKKKIARTLENFGTMKAVELMRDVLPGSFSMLKNWSASRLLETFEKGFLHIDGERVDVTPYKKEATVRYSEVLLSKIRQELKDSYRDIASVVVAGGGAYCIDRKQFGSNVLIPEEPEFSQARGYYRAGTNDN
ncbi:ParM/StbA family protein [Thermodesulfovibrio thiophilus]|uniref:ParM/StbA family protein n=1 Tax=Thermodesulfovibrio thiophilus TaxID=340095 RepID=UPI0003F8B6B7|nr:ParM/StbA family protein [Thermodesulfovibrio thiophilus]